MLRRNFLAGLANSLGSAVIAITVVPFYLRYLGVESYGLIGFFVTLQAMLGLLDMGMAATLVREVARATADGRPSEASRLLHSLARIATLVGVVIGVSIALLAAPIAQGWLRPQGLSTQTVTEAVSLMGLVLACRWPVGLYQGALIGAQRLAVSSLVSLAGVVLGSIGAVGVLAFVSPTIEAFFAWQAAVGLLLVLTMRACAWRVIGRPQQLRFDADAVRRVWRFSLGLGTISLLGVLLTQVDKLILSRTLGLEAFGQYMLATAVASGLHLLAVPVFQIVYPRFSALVAGGPNEPLAASYRTASQLLAAAVFPLAMAVVLAGPAFLRVWTGQPMLATALAPLLSVLVIGHAMNGMVYLPYAVLLAKGETLAMCKLYASLLVVAVPVTVLLSLRYGAAGGALAQALLFCVDLALTAWLAHRHPLGVSAAAWLVRDLGRPLALSASVGLVVTWALPMRGERPWVELGSAAMAALLASGLSLVASGGARAVAADYWRRLRRT